MKQNATEAAIKNALRVVIPAVESESVKCVEAVNFFTTLISKGLDNRDSFQSKSECLDFIKTVDANLHKLLIEKDGAFRDFDIFGRGAEDNVGMTAFMWACLFNWEQTARLLVGESNAFFFLRI